MRSDRVARCPESSPLAALRGRPHCVARSGCSGPSAWSRRSPRCSTRHWRPTRPPSWRSTSISPGRPCWTWVAARATSATPSRTRGSSYFALDADVGELSGLGEIASGTVIGSGMQLPFADESVDVCYSSNVLEHVSDPWRMAEEMVRVTKPRRGRLHLLHRLVRPVGWARDGALALPGRAGGPGSATGGGTAASRRTGSASPCSRSPSRRACDWARTPDRAPTSSTSSPATTRGSPTG